MTEKITIHVAKTNLSKLVARAEAGEEIFIYRGDKRVARLMPIRRASRNAGVREERAAWNVASARKPGALRSGTVIHDSFYDPLSAKDFSQGGVMDSDPEWGEPGVWDGKSQRKPGALKGEITLDDSFFDPLSDEELGVIGSDPQKAKP